MKRSDFVSSINEGIKKPSSMFRGAPFWAWNGKLEPDQLRRQIRLMNEMGLGGFFMHSRVGLATPYLSDEWFECIRACCEEAEKSGMKAYLYDEDRWPSGAAGGLVTKNPKYRMRSLMMEKLEDAAKFKRTKDVIGVFAARVEKASAYDVRKIQPGHPVRLSPGESLIVFRVKMQETSPWYNGYTYLDTLSHEAVRQFIRVTYEAYRKRISSRFGKSVPGIFTDEPNYGGMLGDDWEKTGIISAPWTEKLPRIFRQRYGYDIIDHLPEIFFDVDGQPFTRARYHYHECATFLFVDAFARQIGDWCGKNNLLFTGHVLSEDTLSHQTIVVGDCMRFYQYMQAPGMDLLTECWRIFVTAKQVSSVARQFGRKWRLTETYGCTGWDFPFAGHKALGDWQAALGINLRCPHLAWYTMSGEAKRDYPASIFYQSPWWRFYKNVEDYFARINYIMTEGSEVRDLLVIHPVESMWLKCKLGWRTDQQVNDYDRMFWKLSDFLLAGHIDFDYGNEEIMSQHGRIKRENDDTKLFVGKAPYRCVLVPPLVTMRRSTLDLLKKFRSAGGQVLFAGDIPEYVDAMHSDEVREFAGGCDRVSLDEEALIKAVEKTCRRISIADRSGKQLGPVLYLLREDNQAYYLFICNTGQDFAHSERHIMEEIRVRDRTMAFPDVIISGFPEWTYPAIEIDPETGKFLAAGVERKNNGYEIHTTLPALGSRLFLIPKKHLELRLDPVPNMKEVSRIPLEGNDWEIRLNEPNIVVLDRPKFKISDRDWQPETEILRVDRAVRDALRIPHRGGGMAQPWTRRKNPHPESVPVSLLYSFDAEYIPGGMTLLALEEPQLYRIKVNGVPVSTDMECGWYVDRSLRTIPIDTSLIRPGANEILLECAYSENHPGLEICYLLGDFGVEIRDLHPVIKGPVNSLRLGDWVNQGLPFYSGSVRYIKTIKPSIRENERLFVMIPEYRGVAVRVLVDGEEAGFRGWEPYEVDITDRVTGKETTILEIEVIGHRRNSHGPFHFFMKWPIWTGPGQYVAEGQEWREEYQLVPCGLMAPPELSIRAR